MRYNKWEFRFAISWLALVVIAIQIWLTIDGHWYALPVSLLSVLSIFATMAAIGILIGKWDER